MDGSNIIQGFRTLLPSRSILQSLIQRMQLQPMICMLPPVSELPQQCPCSLTRNPLDHPVNNYKGFYLLQQRYISPTGRLSQIKDTCKFLHMAMILSKSVLIARRKWSDGLCMIGHGNPAFEKCYNREKRPSKKRKKAIR